MPETPTGSAAGPGGAERPFRVAIAGGGIAGLEALIALRALAGDRVDITLVAPEPDFTYRPMTVQEPFSPTPAERRELAPIAAEFGAGLEPHRVAGVRPDDRVLELDDGSEVAYDAAIICIGAPAAPAFEDVATLRAAGQDLPINDLLREAAEHESRRIAFIVPPGVTWPLPIYELAMMSERRAAELDLDVELEVVTPEAAPLVMFGRMVSDAVAELLRTRGIAVRAGAYATQAGGAISLSPGEERLDAGAVVALPVLHGPHLRGVSSDEHGFIPIDEWAKVEGADHLYAAGDGTTFPLKQGGIGTQQADAAAEQIAAAAGADLDPQPFHPILRGKLIAGEESLNLRSDVAGGAGEGVASSDYLWWPPHKVSGRYLAAWLAGETAHADPEPPRHPIEVEVELPREWHREPMALDPYGPFDPT